MATKSIGTLKASLILDNKGFIAGFQQAKQRAKQETGGIAGIVGKFATSAGAQLTAIGTAAVASVVSLHKLSESFERVDRAAKLADRLGITFESMQKLSVAAKLSGADIEVLAKAMLHMGKEIGSGGKALDVRFFEVADAIAKIEDPAKRAERAMKIFGKGGAELLNTLIQGSAGIKKSAEAIDRFGLAMSRADAAKIERANDALSTMRIVVDGLVDKFAASLAPTIEMSVNKALVSLERLLIGFQRLDEGLNRLMGSHSALGKFVKFLDQQLFELGSFPDRVADALGLPKGSIASKPAAPSPAPGSALGADLFSAASKAKAPKPAALEFNTVEAARAINNAGGDATGGVVTELKNILRTIQIFGDDITRETRSKDGFLIREGKL